MRRVLSVVIAVKALSIARGRCAPICCSSSS